MKFKICRDKICLKYKHRNSEKICVWWKKKPRQPPFRLNWANGSGSTENCVYRTSKFSSSGSLFKIPINSLYHPTIMFNLANKPLYALLRLWMSSQDLPCVPDLVCSVIIIMIMPVLMILIISWWSHILTPGCSRDQSVAEVQNLLLLLWEIVHQRFFICWCFYVRQCYLQRTVLQALLWWMFPWWNKGGEMAVWWRDCPTPWKDWPPLSFSSSALSPLSSSFSHPWRILSLRCQQSSAGKTSNFQRPLPLHQDLHRSLFGSTTGSLGFRKLAMVCFRFSREEVANMSVLGRILFTQEVRLFGLKPDVWTTSSEAASSCK